MKRRFIKIPSAVCENLCKSVADLSFSTLMSNRFMKCSCLSISLILLTSSSNFSAAERKTVDDFRAAAAKANAVLTIPDWEQTPEAVEASMKDAIAKGNSALDQIGGQDLSKVTFKSTVVALDDLTYQAGIAANQATIIKETNTNPSVRTAAENAVKVFQEWAVGIDYREDVYKAIKAFADTHPKLTGEDEKLFKETLRDYRRAGLQDWRRRLHGDGKRYLAIHHRGGKREKRSDSQTTLPHSRYPRERQQRFRSQPDACAPEQDRA